MPSSKKTPVKLTARRHPETGLYHLVGENTELLAQANAFLDALTVRGLSPMTVRAYAFDLVVLYRWLGKVGKSIEQLDEAQLFPFIADQRLRKARPSSINRRLVVIQLFYRFVVGEAMKRGKGASTPAPYYRGRGRDRWLGVHVLRRSNRRALRVKTPRTLVEPLTPDQVNGFLKTITRFRDLAIVYLMLLCGLRSQEVLTLEIDDIDLDTHSIHVHGKGDRERLLPMPQTLAQALASYLRLERPRRCDTKRVFVVLKGKHRGQPMTPAGLRSLFRQRRRKPQLARANPHRFRHVFGTDMARCGVRLPVLQKLMGHAHYEMTLKYINLSVEDLAQEFRRALDTLHDRYDIR